MDARARSATSRGEILTAWRTILCLAAAGCLTREEVPPAGLYPDPDWAIEQPEAHGLDASTLEAAAAFAASEMSECLVVVKSGVLVGEWYFGEGAPDRERLVYSVTKSITSALVGIAQDRGELHIDEPASHYIPEWRGTPSESVRIRNLLSNDSGRRWDVLRDYLELPAATDQTAYAVGLDQERPPGTWWEYNNAAIQTLERVLRRATGMNAAAFAERYLFAPIGMQASWGTDSSGNPTVFAGVSSTCRGLARLGLLFLRRGWWSGERVVSSGWVRRSLTQSTPHNSAYGLLWWLNRSGHWVVASSPFRNEGDGRLLPDAPEDAYLALGFQAQIVLVDPTQELVVTRIGAAPSGVLGPVGETRFVNALYARVAAASSGP